MIRQLILVFLLAAVAAATSAKAQLRDVLQPRPRTGSNGLLARRDAYSSGQLLGREFYCNDAGYSQCPGENYCCPTGGLCCHTGGCAVPGGQCCLKGQGGCNPGEECCEYGCIPAGQQCCADGGYCTPGETCVLSYGQIRCCSGSECYGGNGGNTLGGNGGTPTTHHYSYTSYSYSYSYSYHSSYSQPDVSSYDDNTYTPTTAAYSVTQVTDSPTAPLPTFGAGNGNGPSPSNTAAAASTSTPTGAAATMRPDGAMPIIGLLGFAAAGLGGLL